MYKQEKDAHKHQEAGKISGGRSNIKMSARECTLITCNTFIQFLAGNCFGSKTFKYSSGRVVKFELYLFYLDLTRFYSRDTN
jgi:hypothetical protein